MYYTHTRMHTHTLQGEIQELKHQLQTRDSQTRDSRTRDSQTRDSQTRDSQTRDSQTRDSPFPSSMSTDKVYNDRDTPPPRMHHTVRIALCKLAPRFRFFVRENPS